MTVKILTSLEKQAVVVLYQKKTRTIAELAQFLKVSQRTVERVLTEANVEWRKPKAKDSSKLMLEMLYKNKITLEQLEQLIEQEIVEKKQPSAELSVMNVAEFLSKCTQEQFAIILHVAGIQRNPAIEAVLVTMEEERKNPQQSKPTQPIPKQNQNPLFSED